MQLPLTPTEEERVANAQKYALFLKYDLIRESVSAADICNAFGLELDHSNRCRCPFHNGTDRNMKVYPGNKGYYCFVCHEHGDSIRLAQKLISDDCRYHEAAVWIDNTFQLHVFEKKKPSIRERYRRAELYAKAHGGSK